MNIVQAVSAPLEAPSFALGRGSDKAWLPHLVSFHGTENKPRREPRSKPRTENLFRSPLEHFRRDLPRYNEKKYG